LSTTEGYKPKTVKTTGSRPACLVNASVTYCGNDQIYAFGGFDQFTDEVYNHVLRLNLKTLNWALVDNYGDIAAGLVWLRGVDVEACAMF